MRKLALLLVMLLPLAMSCVTKPVDDAGTIVTGANGSRVAGALAVERFLRAANANDLRTMASLFGTVDGPITRIDSEEDVERRMFALASILKHQDFQLRGERIVPGRLGGAVELLVAMTTMASQTVVVPFTVVKARGDQWLVEQIDVQPLIGGR